MVRNRRRERKNHDERDRYSLREGNLSDNCEEAKDDVRERKVENSTKERGTGRWKGKSVGFLPRVKRSWTHHVCQPHPALATSLPPLLSLLLPPYHPHHHMSYAVLSEQFCQRLIKQLHFFNAQYILPFWTEPIAYIQLQWKYYLEKKSDQTYSFNIAKYKVSNYNTVKKYQRFGMQIKSLEQYIS